MVSAVLLPIITVAVSYGSDVRASVTGRVAGVVKLMSGLRVGNAAYGTLMPMGR